MMRIETIETESLGNRGYLIHDGTTAVALDVQRDYKRWIEAAEAADVTISYVLETHMHNDYVTGGYQLAKKLSAAYVIPANSGAAFESLTLDDNESIEVGDIKITGLHTPGHTEHHMSYLMTDGAQNAVFTGGGVLFGTVGRTDLVSKDKTDTLTRAQYDSAQRLGAELPDETVVFPTHGFGSFCSSAAGSGATSSSMATEKKTNIAFTADRDAFVRQIIAGLGTYPRYYAHMGVANQSGPGEVRQLHIHSYAAEEMGRQLQQENAWVIDVRSRTLFAAHHPKGAVGIELGKSFATYTGWIIPWSDKLVLVGDTEKDLLAAYTELSRIGMEQFVDGATHDMQTYLSAGTGSSYKVVNFNDLKSVIEEKPFILDVRQVSEWNDAHIPGACNIPLHELMERIQEVPQGPEIWVHCGSGYRASIAASLLDKNGRTPVLIDDGFQQAKDTGLAK